MSRQLGIAARLIGNCTLILVPLAREALYVESSAQQRHPFHHSQQAEGIASLQRLFDLETDSIVFNAKFNRVIGRIQVNVYERWRKNV